MRRKPALRGMESLPGKAPVGEAGQKMQKENGRKPDVQGVIRRHAGILVQRGEKPISGRNRAAQSVEAAF